MLLKVSAVISLLVLEASAFWRLPCDSRVALERIDPIVNPGGISAHVHTIHGPNSFSANSTYEDLMGGSCTSCQVKQDRSAYWTPALYHMSKDGKFNAVPQKGGMLAYYLQRGQNVKAFPEGFRMIAGDPFLRSFTYREIEKSLWEDQDRTEAALRQRAVGFNCLNYDEPAQAALGLRRMPEDMSRCVNGLRAEVFFPSCWDGKNLDSANHKDHMAYPSLMDDGVCPDSHPVRLVSIFFETIWDVNQFVGQDGEFVFSTGDPHGYGNHGDFMMGWDKDFLQSAIDQCTNLSGMIQDCPLFDIATVQEMHSCTVPKVQVQEEVEGPLDKLPGCNAIVYGTERVTPEQQCPEAKPEDPKPQVENVKTQQVAVKSQVESSTSTTLVPVVTSSSTIAQVETRLPVIDPNVVEVVVTITSWETVNVYATAPPVKPSGVVRRRHGHMGMHKKIHGRS